MYTIPYNYIFNALFYTVGVPKRDWYRDVFSTLLNIYGKVLMAKSTIHSQKTKFFIKYFFSKCDQIRSFLRISSYLLKKCLMENFIFCTVIMNIWQVLSNIWLEKKITDTTKFVG